VNFADLLDLGKISLATEHAEVAVGADNLGLAAAKNADLNRLAEQIADVVRALSSVATKPGAHVAAANGMMREALSELARRPGDQMGACRGPGAPIRHRPCELRTRGSGRSRRSVVWHKRGTVLWRRPGEDSYPRRTEGCEAPDVEGPIRRAMASRRRGRLLDDKRSAGPA